MSQYLVSSGVCQFGKHQRQSWVKVIGICRVCATLERLFLMEEQITSLTIVINELTASSNSNFSVTVLPNCTGVDFNKYLVMHG